MYSFDIKRVYHFVYRDILIRKDKLITALLGVGGLFFLFCLLNLRGDYYISSGEFSRVFGFFYLILGVLFVFSVSKETHDSQSNHLYLALPVSVYERILAIWIITTILYTIVMLVISLIFGQFAIIVGGVFFGTDFHLVPMFSGEYFSALIVYFMIQPVFLVGALAFRQNRIGKTFLSLVLMTIVLCIYNLMLFSMLNFRFDVFPGDSLANEAFYDAWSDFSIIGFFVFGMILGPVMFFIAYCKMIEKEV